LRRSLSSVGWIATLLLAPLAHAGEPSDAGIAWHEGGVAGAFNAARAANKPVLLYWGAKWCPPCQQLKAFVFTRSDFIEKSKQFIAVHLDGDDPDAQHWAGKFHVSGYPTVVILRADQREITRISGGNDLSSYANLLDAALRDIKPLASVLAVLRKNPAALTPSDCRRLAYYPWLDSDDRDAAHRSLAVELAQSARACGHSSPAERARMVVASAALAPAPNTTERVIDIVHDAQLASQVVDALEGLREPFFVTVAARGPAVSSRFQSDWIRTMDQVADDPHVADPDRLYAVATKLDLVRQFAPDKKVPAPMAADASSRAATDLGKRVDPYARAAVVNAASDIYDKLEDDDAQYALLQSEVKTAKAPYYYMVDIAEIEENRGREAEAVRWYARAYRESEGPATRFQWGALYLTALLRLAPRDRDLILKVGTQVIAELDGPERIEARTRGRLEKLDSKLRLWNGDHRHDDDVAALRTAMRGVCAKLPHNDSGLDSCRKFLS
jgi:thiol-disulfide isomerase/thioredoxin